jgi:hypothetical protein
VEINNNNKYERYNMCKMSAQLRSSLFLFLLWYCIYMVKLSIYDAHRLWMFCVYISVCAWCVRALCVFFVTAAIIHVCMLHVLFDIIRHHRWFLLFALSMSNE